MKTKTNKSAAGTSFHQTTILSSVHELEFNLGKPTYEDNSGHDKVNYEWVCEDDLGNVFTIYTWKEYRPLNEFEKINFHIGGKNKMITENAKRELEEFIGRDLTDERQERFYEELNSGRLDTFDKFVKFATSNFS